MRTLFGLLALGAMACSSKTPVGAEIEVVYVDPRIVPPEVPQVEILFRVTRQGALRVEANDLPDGADPVVGRVDDVAVGGLASVSFPRRDFMAGPHLVTLVLTPGDGSPSVDAEASFVIAEEVIVDDPDAGVPGEDSGVPTCEESCAGEAPVLVCGSDGHTYDNRCLLACAGATELFEGDCSNPEACLDRCFDEGFSPVCGDNGDSYFNECEAECEGTTVDHPGPCIEF